MRIPLPFAKPNPDHRTDRARLWRPGLLRLTVKTRACKEWVLEVEDEPTPWMLNEIDGDVVTLRMRLRSRMWKRLWFRQEILYPLGLFDIEYLLTELHALEGQLKAREEWLAASRNPTQETEKERVE